MNIKTIKTNGKNVCIVQVPEGATDITISDQNGLWYRSGKVWDDSAPVCLPPGNWRILGLSNELSEEQMKDVCEVAQEVSYWDDINDEYFVYYGHDGIGARYAHTVQESYASFLTANKLFSENPYRKPESRLHHFHYTYELDLVRWQEAQQHVGKYLILIEE